MKEKTQIDFFGVKLLFDFELFRRCYRIISEQLFKRRFVLENTSKTISEPNLIEHLNWSSGAAWTIKWNFKVKNKIVQARSDANLQRRLGNIADIAIVWSNWTLARYRDKIFQRKRERNCNNNWFNQFGLIWKIEMLNLEINPHRPCFHCKNIKKCLFWH